MLEKEAAQRLFDRGEITAKELALVKEAAAPLVNFAFQGAQAAKPAGLSMLQKAILGLSLGALGIGTVKEVSDHFKQQEDIASSYRMMKDKVPLLNEYPQEKINDYFDVVKTFSPLSASNPLVAVALVHKMLEFGGVDHKLVQDIAKIERSPFNGILANVAQSAPGNSLKFLGGASE